MNYLKVCLNAGTFAYSEAYLSNGTNYLKLINYPCIADKKALQEQDDAFIYCNAEGIWLVY